MEPFETAPPLEIGEWINTPGPLSLSGLRGHVVMLHAVQMLCPGCVSHGLPQASKVREMFAEDDVAVIGLHTFFEYHEVMGANALKAFIHEYRSTFPIGIDKCGSGDVPLTMQAYALQGTPSLVLIDRLGRVRLNHFGRIDDMALGALIGQLSAESSMGHVATKRCDKRPTVRNCWPPRSHSSCKKSGDCNNWLRVSGKPSDPRRGLGRAACDGFGC